MNQHTLSILAVGASVLLVPMAQGGPEPSVTALYGDRLREVQNTPEFADDSALARVILDDAAKVSNAALRADMLVLVSDLGMRDASGHSLSLDAITKLMAVAPNRALDWKRREVAVHTLAHNATRSDATARSLALAMTGLSDLQADVGKYDEAASSLREARAIVAGMTTNRDPNVAFIDWRLQVLSDLQHAKKRLSSLTAANKPSPDLGDIAIVLIMELADFSAELPRLESSGDQDVPSRVIQLATTRTELLGATDAKYLLDWILAHIDTASVRGRVSSYAMVMSLCDEYLAKRTTVDAERLSVESTKARAERQLRTLLPPESDFPLPNVGALKATGWNARTVSTSVGRGVKLDCLRLIDLSRDTMKGPWSRGTDGTISVAMVDMHREGPLIRVPVHVTGSYDFQGKFQRTAGGDAIMFGLPAAKGRFRVVLGSPEGLRVAGKQYKQQQTNLVNGRDYEIAVRVRLEDDLARIVVVLNGEELHNARWPLTALNEASVWVVAEEGAPSISVVDSAYTIKNYTVTPLGGTIRPLRKGTATEP